MKLDNLILKFEEDKKEFLFDKNLSFTDDKKLVKTLSRSNIKNINSSLIIKSMNNTPIYDVIQLKINVLETGSFLVNFEKESFDENKRKNLIEAISALKDKEEPTLEKQIIKINKVIEILNKEDPLFATFKPSGDMNLSKEDIESLTKTSFILLVLLKKQKEEKEDSKFVIAIKTGFASFAAKIKSIFRKKEKQPKEKKSHKIVIDFPLFSFDYLFISIFTLFFGFGVYTGIFEIMVGESISIFLLILALIFLGVLYFSFYSTIFKRKIEKNKKVKYWLLVYVFFGAALSILLAYLITTYVIALKEDQTINLSLLLGISIPSTFALSLVSPLVSKLINLIICKFKK